MTNEKSVAARLLQVEAVKLSPENPYTWASGWKSPIYCDNRKVLSFPYDRDFIKSELCSVIFEQFPDVDAIAGMDRWTVDPGRSPVAFGGYSPASPRHLCQL
jgi:orotate phosphoribosyltransferase